MLLIPAILRDLDLGSEVFIDTPPLDLISAGMHGALFIMSIIVSIISSKSDLITEKLLSLFSPFF